MNHELHKEIEVWRKARKDLEETARYHQEHYSDPESVESMASDYGRPTVCTHNRIVFHLTPKLVAEIEFLNRVIAGLVDETAAAETVLRLERENRKLRKELNRIATHEVSSMSFSASLAHVKTIAYQALTAGN